MYGNDVTETKHIAYMAQTLNKMVKQCQKVIESGFWLKAETNM